MRQRVCVGVGTYVDGWLELWGDLLAEELGHDVELVADVVLHVALEGRVGGGLVQDGVGPGGGEETGGAHEVDLALGSHGLCVVPEGLRDAARLRGRPHGHRGGQADGSQEQGEVEVHATHGACAGGDALGSFAKRKTGSGKNPAVGRAFTRLLCCVSRKNALARLGKGAST